MKFRLRTLLIFMAVIPLPFVLLPMLTNWAMGFDTAMDRRYDAVKCGELLESAMVLLGEPYEATEYFSRALASYESDLPPAEVAKCSQFLTWRNGGNWFYCVGVDKHGKIIVKIQGHS